MFHNEPDRGRRPLLSTFDGNNRQMLQEIRDSLSHHLRNNDGDAESVSHLQHVRPELSQSTPNLLEKISGASTKNMTRMGYNKKAMAEIRNSLRPFQTNNESPNSSGTGQQMNGDTYADPHVNRHFLQQLIAMGFDEDLSCKVLKLSGNKSVEAARELIVRLSEEPKNGYPKGLGYTKVHRKPSFEMKYGQNSPDSSVRSESPGMNVHARGPYMQCNSSSNGHQTPPPLPPRAPIVPSVNRGQTPPYSNDQTLVSNSQQVSPGQNQQSCIPPGHVQQLIKKMSPSSTQIVRPQVVQSDPISEQNVQPLIQNGSPQHNSNNQQQIGQQTVIVQNNQNPQRPNYVLTPQFQHLTISHSNHNNNINNLSTNTNGNSADVTIKYTPTYNPQHMHPTPVSLQRTVNDQTHMISQVPEYTKYESHLTVNKNSHVTTSGSDCVQISLPRRTEPSPPLAAPAAMQAWTQQPPIIMKSVKSQKVSKPVLQTATAPVSFQPPSGSPQNFISSVQAQVNSSQKQAHQHNNNFEIEITRQRQNHHNNLQSQLQQMQAHSKGQQTIKVKIHPYPHNQTNFQIQNFPNSRDYYARSSSETPTSTPRSDSPVSRAMNHSPLSMLSTTSSPSTNSDIPDKPPPPYPGRTVNYPTHYNQGQPPIPPRVPIHPQNKPPPPPPPQYTITSNVPVQTILPNQMHRLPPPPLASVIESDQQSQQSSNSVTSSNCQDGPGDETDNDVQSETHSETHSDGSREKHCCTSPIPERKPENKEMDSFRYDTKVRNYSPQAFKFFMEQHVENLLKSHQQRQKRRLQLEKEMSKAQLSEEAQSQMRRMLHQKESNYNRLKRAKMDKSMFTKIETLGVGAFGEVALVRKKDGGQLYAMKTLQKNDVLKRNQVAHVKAERDILAEADHEWVVKLYYSFQDKDNLYFVMDYIPGGDLMGLLIKFGIFEEPLSRFYIAELVLAIESVHKMGFIHRDIKPDNILIDKDGHIKLTDFGLCTGFRWTHNSKLYQVNQKDGNHLRQDSMELGCLKEECNCDIHKPLERRRQRDKQRCVAQSLVGTPNYIAPEVLLRQGYTACCDWWSVGVILYEMLVGSPPFYADSPLETQKKVIGWKETLQIPEGADLSQPAKDLILRLCCDSEYRLGRNGASEIKDHSFFHPIEFTNLRKQSAPFIPVISHATDTRYFDPVDPDKLRKSDSDSENLKKYEVPGENGKHPQHAFFEFTFRRFFDDGGHPYPKIKDPDAPVGNRTK